MSSSFYSEAIKSFDKERKKRKRKNILRLVMMSILGICMYVYYSGLIGNVSVCNIQVVKDVLGYVGYCDKPLEEVFIDDTVDL